MAYRVKNKTKRPTKPVREESEDDEEDDENYFADDEDDEDEEPPRRSKGKSRRSRDDEDDDDDDDDDEEYVIEGGWGASHRNKAETSNFPNGLKLGDDPALAIILDDEPLASYKQHWIERKGKKSFYCIGADCPLCANGDKPRPKNIFNVVRLDEGTPVNLVLEAGPMLTDILESKSQRAPLTKGYWSIARTGTAGRTNYDVTRVKERDLEEDWDIEPLDADQLKKLRMSKWSKEDVVNITPRKDLVKIAKEMTGDYDEDDD